MLVRAAAFFVFAGALPALLPIVVRNEVGGGAGTFGLLLGCIGVGAIAGALCLPALRSRLGTETLVLAASLLCAATLLALAWLRQAGALVPVMLLNGLAWICVLSSLQVGISTCDQFVAAVANVMGCKTMSIEQRVSLGNETADFWSLPTTRLTIDAKARIAEACGESLHALQQQAADVGCMP